MILAALNCLYFQVPPELAGERIDKVLAAYCDELSRTYLKSLLLQGKVQVNGKIVLKPSHKVRSKDRLIVELPPPARCILLPEQIPLDIRFEDEDILVVNKPRGMVVHPGAGCFSGTLVNALLFHCQGRLSGISGVSRPGIVHRLDKDTTGLLVVAKHDIAHRALALQFQQRTIKREYLALVHGVIQQDSGVIDAPLARDPRFRQRMAVVATGKQAITYFTVLERFASATFVRCRLATGRTHQIRVHFKYLGHPLIGDTLYGFKKDDALSLLLSGQALHAHTLAFNHPVTCERMSFSADLPDDMQTLLAYLRKS